MNGLPGPYIKDFMKNLGHSGGYPTIFCGISISDHFWADIGLNSMLVGFPNKGATAICTFAYCAGPGAEPVLFVGETEGEIVQARGPTHFGWDAVFQAAGTGQTYVY
jgi:inosine triphosphate pyrophosphatase